MTPATVEPSVTGRVTMGRPAAEALADECGKLGAARVFILASRHLHRATDEIRAVEAALGPLHAGSWSGIGEHVPLTHVLAAAAAAREASADLLVTIGGGSVIDAGKLVALCLTHAIGDPAGFAAFRSAVGPAGAVIVPAFEGPDIRMVAVPTTLSGAEFSAIAGATDAATRTKSVYEQRDLAPVCVVLDPAITRHTPQWLWLSTGVRSVDHAIETLSSPHSNPFCDGMAESALRLLVEALPRVKAVPDDLDARLRCQVGAWQSMIPIGAGVPMGASHAIGHVLGGTCGIAHGHTSCIMAPHVLAWNAPANADRQARISACFGAPDRSADQLVESFIRDLGMPQTLREVGIDEAALPLIAETVLHDIWAKTNARPLTGPEQVLSILKPALGRRAEVID